MPYLPGPAIPFSVSPMAAKRDRPDDPPAGTSAEAGPPPKKARHGFRVGPANLPDGPWRRKLARTKQELIQSAKVKKAYAKLKAREAAAAAGAEGSGLQMHPERAAMLDSRPSAPGETGAARPHETAAPAVEEDPARGKGDDPRGVEDVRGDKRGRRAPKRPDYFRKDLAVADKRRREAEEREAERQRRQEERQRALAARTKNERAMAKAKVRGRDGQRKLGRESSVLLEKVKKMVGR